MNNPSLSVFFPCHNEVENIGPLTEKTVQVLREKGMEDFEVIIVNDGSVDGTREKAEELAQEFPEVRAVHHEVNQGYGAAVWTGLRSAAKEYVFFTDGDGQFDILEIEKFLAEMKEYDALLGYRIQRADPWYRKLFAFGWGKIWVPLMIGVRVRDLDCAFKMFRRDLFDGMEPETGGAMVTAEILAKLFRRGIRYKQIGVKHLPRMAGEQSGGSLKVILRAFVEMARLRKKLKQG